MTVAWPVIDAAIAHATGTDFVSTQRRSASGGSINRSFVVADGRTRYFVKLNTAESQAMFEAEAAGLTELQQAVGLRVPRPIAQGVAGDHTFLVLEYIALQSASPGAMGRLGEALADMHGIVTTRYGWRQDNTIGSTPQLNALHPNWAEFWRENRMAVMFDALAADHPALARDGDALLAVLDVLLAGHRPEPSLLHGDFWGGNMAMDEAGRPVIFDPAVYYGDRETDLAMAELFGGFSPLFFEAYWGAWPMSPGYREIRRPLYQLYHLLNHARLFGGHYVAESRRVLRRLLDSA